MERTEIYLVSVKEWIHCLQISAAVYSKAGREVFLINPDSLNEDLESLALLGKRLPVDMFDCTGDPALKLALENKEGLSFKGVLPGPGAGLDQISLIFGRPKGLVCAPADDPSRCLQAAVMAVRLGFYFLAPQSGDALSASGLPDEPLIWLGPHREPVNPAAATICLDGAAAMADYLKQAGCPVDYLVLVNSADLTKPTLQGRCLGELWVQGLSLFGVTLASYRNAFLLDAAQALPDPGRIESMVNDCVRQAGLSLKYQAVVASPGAIPFFYEEKKNIGETAEEMVRDIHVRLNDDLFFDLAEGRLFQHNPGGLSVQLISTKRYGQIRAAAAAGASREVLIVGSPHVESGIIFATDDSIISAQLLPLLKQTENKVKLLIGEEAHHQKICAALLSADIFLYTGHGGPESLHTHGRSLTRYALPALPPLVAYASACSTLGLVPHWYSLTEGAAWQGIPVDSREVIGLSFVEKGALCFVGGATIEDLQYSSSIYGIFMEALLIKGLSVGEAVKETRNFISLYASTLLQKAPPAYEKYRWSTANAIHQQLLLGDPAFIPAEEKNAATALPLDTAHSANRIRLIVYIPKERWRRSKAVVNEKEPSKKYYRSRNVEMISPYGQDVINWGDCYRIAPDADEISDNAVISSLLHLKLTLPPDTMPVRLSLIDAQAGPGECLLCGQEAPPPALSTLDRARRFKLPYLMQPPLELDMREGWAFTVEQQEDLSVAHWLAPLLLIDEYARSAYPLERLIFEMETAPRRICRGVVECAPIPERNSPCLVVAGLPRSESGELTETGKALAVHCQSMALTGSGGAFTISCSGDAVLSVEQHYPLYELPGPYLPYDRQNWPAGEASPRLILTPGPPEPGFLQGRLYDSRSGSPLCGALVRAFRGEIDPVGDPLVEAFAEEATAGTQGDFTLKLPAGKYLLYAAAPAGGKRYKSGRWAVEIERGQEQYRIFTLDEAVVIRGRVAYEGTAPPEPAVIAVKKYPRKAGETLVKMPVKRDGSFECLVGFQERFIIVLEEEGWLDCEDTNNGQGYRLKPGEILERNFTLLPAEGR